MIAIYGCSRQVTIWSSSRSRTAERSIFPTCGGPSGKVRRRAPRTSRLARLCARSSASTWMWSQRGESRNPTEGCAPRRWRFAGCGPPASPRFRGVRERRPFQQLSLDAGVAIVSRLVERFGKRLEHEGRGFYAFPKAQAIADARIEALRACGLSLGKAESIRSLARLIESRQLSAEKLAGMSTNDALETLTDLPGIGPWSAGLVLLRGLGRLDVFPSGDVGAERGLRTLLRAGADVAQTDRGAIRRPSRISLLLCARRQPLGERSDPPGSLTVLGRRRVRSRDLAAMQVANLPRYRYARPKIARLAIRFMPCRAQNTRLRLESACAPVRRLEATQSARPAC